jgi:hypothetical protein
MMRTVRLNLTRSGSMPAAAAGPAARPGLAGPGLPQPARPEADGQQVIALARRDPQGHTVSLILDAATANIALYAITAHARDREAHLREVEQYGQTLPEASSGRANRQAIAAREARLAARLRAVEHAYRTALDRDTAFSTSERAKALRVADHEDY